MVAYAKWAAAGKPLRDPARVAELFSICEACPTRQFIRVDNDSGRCAVCACHLHRGMGELNKLAWPTEGCPHKAFEAEVSPEPNSE